MLACKLACCPWRHGIGRPREGSAAKTRTNVGAKRMPLNCKRDTRAGGEVLGYRGRGWGIRGTFSWERRGNF